MDDKTNKLTVFEDLVNASSHHEINENDYRAFEISRSRKSEIMIAVLTNDGKRKIFHCFEIKDILIENDKLLSIIRPHEVITLKGRHFDSMAHSFQDHAIRTITEFNPAIHKNKINDSQPFIEEIVITLIK